MLLISITLLTGCLNYIQDVNLYPDGSGKITLHYWMSLNNKIDSQNLLDVKYFNPLYLRQEYSSNYYKIEGIKIYSDTTDNTTHALINITFDDIDSLNNTKAFHDVKFSLKDDEDGVKTFTQTLPSELGDSFYKISSINLTYKYTFYGKILEDNSDEKDGKTLIWYFNSSDKKNNKKIFAKYKPFKLRETPEWIYILMGIVFLVVMVFLLKKNKN